MTDYTELKRLATRIVEVQTSQDAPISKLFDDFDAATSPEVILALIAENERLRESDQESTELCDTLSALLGQIAVAVRGPEEPKSRHGFHDLPSRVKTVVAERDHLKAQNEALREEIEHSKTNPLYSTRVNSRRYVWLRDNHIGDNPESINLDPGSRPGLNSAIDAAMGKGEQS